MSCIWTINRNVQPELRHRVGQWNLKSIDTRTLIYSKFHSGGTETSCFLLLWLPEGQVQQHVHSVKLCWAIQWNHVAPARSLQQIVAFYCYLPFHKANHSGRGWVPCRRQASTPSHNENIGWYSSRARSWKRQCLYHQPGPALFLQV